MNKSSYQGIYRGVVEDVNDPLKLGRCRIRVPAVHGHLTSSEVSLLPWARYISPLPTGMKKGMYIIPEVKDIVWVMFEGGDKLYPVYLGSTYGVVKGTNEVPLNEEEDPLTTEVLYSSKDSSKNKALIKKNKDGLFLYLGESFINLKSDGSVVINSTGPIEISSKSEVTLKGTKINTINTGGEDV